MRTTFKFLVFFMATVYVLVAGVNFSCPITQNVSFIIGLLSLILAIWKARSIHFKTFGEYNEIYAVYFLGLFLALGIVTVLKSSIFIDTHIYHLPLSLLMNKSIWFPGIGKISHHMAFANGTSVLSSIFTSTNIVGFENIINYLSWVMLGMGTFLYLIKQSINKYLSLFLSLVFMFSGDFFFQSYNMGTDLPCAMFMLFGLLAIKDKNYSESLFLFAMSAIFKPLGLIAFGMTFIYSICIRKIEWKNHLVISSILIMSLYFIRMYVSTGNPFYPLLQLQLAPWGFTVSEQQAMINGSLLGYTGVERTIKGAWELIKAAIFNPTQFKSNIWYGIMFLGCAVTYFFYCFRWANVKKMFNFVNFMILVILVVWFKASPIIRFIEGILAFAMIRMVIGLYRVKIGSFFKFLIVIGTICSVVVLSAISCSYFMTRFKFDGVQRVPHIYLKDQPLRYFKAGSSRMGRVPQPCISKFTIGDPEEFIKRYERFNRLR